MQRENRIRYGAFISPHDQLDKGDVRWVFWTCERIEQPKQFFLDIWQTGDVYVPVACSILYEWKVKSSILYIL